MAIDPSPTQPRPEDKRLERLFDYTKWHIGIYLSMGGGLVGLLGTREGNCFLCRVIAVPWLMGTALGALAIAGIAGGIVTSATTRCRTFEEVWDEDLPLYGRKTLTGKTWASIEHTAFWISLALIAASIFLPASARRDCSVPCPADSTSSSKTVN